MARYTGPVCRICRRFGEKLLLKGEKCYTRCTLEKRNAPPGEHMARRRRRPSERGLQLIEKQKARFMYGVQERQLRRYFAQAERSPGVTGESLLRILEMRLDSIVHRLGFAPSRPAARQLILHGHLSLNGHKHDIPSTVLKPGDTVAFRPETRDAEVYRRAEASIQGRYLPPWLSLDAPNLSGRVLAAPSRGDIDVRIDEKSIVEYYSR
ncbi:MAG: 30S ribosomal protein S4 [Chloroflexi bacterium]|nr:30S ribosomal protein S4 [Chloroflexota bacterium]